MTVFADQDLLHDFLTEAGEMLDRVDVKLVELESRPDDRDLLNEIFRGFHTIKGGGGFLEATALVELCHRAENLLDRLRNGGLTLTAEILDVILASTGEVKHMFAQMEGQREPELSDPGLLDQIDAVLEGHAAAAPALAPEAAASGAVEVAPAAQASPDAVPDDAQWWSSLLQALVAPARMRPTTAAADRFIRASYRGDDTRLWIAEDSARRGLRTKTGEGNASHRRRCSFDERAGTRIGQPGTRASILYLARPNSFRRFP